MSHWLLDSISDTRIAAIAVADRVQFYREMAGAVAEFDAEAIQGIAAALELAVLDLEMGRLTEDPERRTVARQAAADGFRLLRVLTIPDSASDAGKHLLRASVLAVLGDRGADAARWLRSLADDDSWPALPIESA